jgi:hypothetical protein
VAARERLVPLVAGGRRDGGGVFRRCEAEGQVPVPRDVPQVFGDPVGEHVGIFDVIAPGNLGPAQPLDQLRAHLRKDIRIPQRFLDRLESARSVGA